MKHFKQILLAVLVALASSVTTFAQDNVVNGIWYYLGGSPNGYADGGVTVMYPGEGRYSFESIDIPETVSVGTTEYRVTGIYSHAFYGCEELTSISIPSTMKRIDCSAFLGTNVERINISDLSSWCNITFEDYSEYQICSPEGSLYIDGIRQNDIIIPDGITKINPAAFKKITMHSVTIPGSVTEIGESAFESSYISSLTLSEGLKKINCKAFYALGVSSITIPSTVTEIHDAAFSYAPLVESVTVKGKVPPTCVSTPGHSFFEDIDIKKCTLYVPVGTKALL